MRTVIEGGTIVNEGRTFDGTILIEDGNIVDIVEGQRTKDKGQKTIGVPPIPLQ